MGFNPGGGGAIAGATDVAFNSLQDEQVLTYDTTSAKWQNAKANKSVAVTSVTAAYTLVLADAGKVIEMNVASQTALTVPPNSSVAYPVGTTIGGFQVGTGQVSIIAGTGVTLQSRGNALRTAGQFASFTLRKRATNTWELSGDLTDTASTLVFTEQAKTREPPSYSVGGFTWGVHTEGVTTATSKLEKATDADVWRFTLGEPGTAAVDAAERIEFEGGTINLPYDTDVWCAFSSKVTGLPVAPAGQGWPAWCNLFQVHQRPDAGDTFGPQPMGLVLQGDGSLVLTIRNSSVNPTTAANVTFANVYTQANWPLDVWHNFVFRLRFDRGAGTGWVGMWIDGTPAYNQQRALGYNDVQPNFPKFGLYRQQSPGVMTHEVANFELTYTASLASRITNPTPLPT